MSCVSGLLCGRLRSGAFLLFCVVLFGCTSPYKASSAPAAIASAHPLATQAGMDILAAGDNAFDAAVAVSSVLAVVEPYSSGIGGGGFWLLHRESDGLEVMIDGRERAPLAATPDMYLDEAGEVIPGLSIKGALAAGIPGEPAALVHIAERYGSLPLARSLAPAIHIAREGFRVDEYYRRMAQFRLDALQEDDETASIFLHDDELPDVGHTVTQSDLALTLKALATEGRAGFYQGKVAKQLLDEVRNAGGIWTQADLDQYQIVERRPIVGQYRDMRIVSAAPPSSGGVALLTMLNILSGFPLQDLDTVGRTHVIVEAMRRAYRDRAEFLGDPDFYDVPVAQLISKANADALSATIEMQRATPSAVLPAVAPPPEGNHTTHFSVLDGNGNRVAATLSINYPFGACFTPPGTGVLLNDELDDFSER